MNAWTADELSRIGKTEELQVTSRRADGSLRRWVTIWVVRVGDDLYVRSARGPDNPWNVRARTTGVGRIRAGGLERDVTFIAAAPDLYADVDGAYHRKYDRYGPQIVGTVVGEPAGSTTLRVLPRGA